MVCEPYIYFVECVCRFCVNFVILISEAHQLYNYGLFCSHRAIRYIEPAKILLVFEFSHLNRSKIEKMKKKKKKKTKSIINQWERVKAYWFSWSVKFGKVQIKNFSRFADRLPDSSHCLFIENDCNLSIENDLDIWFRCRGHLAIITPSLKC